MNSIVRRGRTVVICGSSTFYRKKRNEQKNTTRFGTSIMNAVADAWKGVCDKERSSFSFGDLRPLNGAKSVAQ